jgi:hypothetical protein
MKQNEERNEKEKGREGKRREEDGTTTIMRQ